MLVAQLGIAAQPPSPTPTVWTVAPGSRPLAPTTTRPTLPSYTAPTALAPAGYQVPSNGGGGTLVTQPPPPSDRGLHPSQTTQPVSPPTTPGYSPEEETATPEVMTPPPMTPPMAPTSPVLMPPVAPPMTTEVVVAMDPVELPWPARAMEWARTHQNHLLLALVGVGAIVGGSMVLSRR